MNNRIIETERLILKRIEVEDYKQVFLWVSDPLVTKYLRFETYTNEEDVKSWITSQLDNKNHFGLYLKDGTLIGSGGLELQDDNYYEVGYCMNKDYWGNGYATEAFRALMDYYRFTLGIHLFKIGHAVENKRSESVALKLGFKNKIKGSYSSFDNKRTYDCFYYYMDYRCHENSYGAVLYKNENNEVMFLLERMGLGHISLPKGHIEKDETIKECTEREIYEELGIKANIDYSKSYVIRYSPFDGVIKDVTFFIGTPLNNDIKVDNNEVLEAKYYNFKDAYNLLTFESDKKTLKWAYERINNETR